MGNRLKWFVLTLRPSMFDAGTDQGAVFLEDGFPFFFSIGIKRRFNDGIRTCGVFSRLCDPLTQVVGYLFVL